MTFLRLTHIRSSALVLGALVLAVSGCASQPKRTTPKLSELEGKKVALIEVESEPTQRQMIEVSLVNQLVRDGTFELVSKQAVDKARTLPDVSPTDWREMARRAGADLALRAKVLEFKAEDHEGWTRVEREDSVLAAELGESARKHKQLVRAKSIEGSVKVELAFTDLRADGSAEGAGETRSAVAEATETVASDQSEGPIQLPLKMRFLEKLTNRAFAEFFEKYRD